MSKSNSAFTSLIKALYLLSKCTHGTLSSLLLRKMAQENSQEYFSEYFFKIFILGYNTSKILFIWSSKLSLFS